MDDRRFDELSRLLGDAATRRAGLKVALAAVLGGPAAVAAVEERAEAGKDRHRGRGKDAGPEAGKKKKRKKCDPACAAGQRCVKGACVCDNGGTVCGAECCAIGQRCEGGQCVSDPAPDACIAFGEACKGVGRRCCDGLVCASGQGGQGDIGCYVGKTGACTSTAECTYGTRCEDGVCKGIPQPPPGPNPEPDTCIQPGASGCTGNADCCDSGSVCNDGRCACDAATCDGLCCSGRCVTLENLTFRNVGIVSNTEFPNTFDLPTYVLPTPDGLTMYVAGYANYDVTIWTRPSVGGTWTKVATLGTGSSGSANNKFDLPYGLALSSDQKTLFVADSNNNRVSVWSRPDTSDHNGWQPAYQITSTLATGLDEPIGLWLSPDDQTLTVSATDSDNVYVLKSSTGSTPPWTLEATLGGQGTSQSKMWNPYNAFCNAAADECLVSDSENKRISVWRKSATGWSGTTQASEAFPCASALTQSCTFANQPNSTGSLFSIAGPYQGYLSPNGNVYWAMDQANNRMVAFRKTNGSWNGVSGVVAMPCANALAGGCPSGSTTSQLLGCEGMYTSIATGEIFIADTGNSRISIWTGCPV